MATLLLRASRFGRATEGATAVEMALVILLFLFIIYAIFQFSMAMYIWNSMMLAAEVGGRQAMIHNSVYDGTSKGCDYLWTTWVEPNVEANLPGDRSNYKLNYACQGAAGTAPPTMTIQITYALGAGPQFASTMAIPGFTLTGEETVPLD